MLIYPVREIIRHPGVKPSVTRIGQDGDKEALTHLAPDCRVASLLTMIINPELQ